LCFSVFRAAPEGTWILPLLEHFFSFIHRKRVISHFISFPLGGLAIPSRNLFVVASEEDERGLDIRGSISIYKKGFGQPIYPFILSRDHEPNIPIPFGALSSLATGKCRRQEVRVGLFCEPMVT
jgi:hypothetical protein